MLRALAETGLSVYNSVDIRMSTWGLFNDSNSHWGCHSAVEYLPGMQDACIKVVRWYPGSQEGGGGRKIRVRGHSHLLIMLEATLG